MYAEIVQEAIDAAWITTTAYDAMTATEQRAFRQEIWWEALVTSFDAVLAARDLTGTYSALTSGYMAAYAAVPTLSARAPMAGAEVVSVLSGLLEAPGQLDHLRRARAQTLAAYIDAVVVVQCAKVDAGTDPVLLAEVDSIRDTCLGNAETVFKATLEAYSDWDAYTEQLFGGYEHHIDDGEPVGVLVDHIASHAAGWLHFLLQTTGETDLAGYARSLILEAAVNVALYNHAEKVAAGESLT